MRRYVIAVSCINEMIYVFCSAVLPLFIDPKNYRSGSTSSPIAVHELVKYPVATTYLNRETVKTDRRENHKKGTGFPIFHTHIHSDSRGKWQAQLFLRNTVLCESDLLVS